VRRPGLRIGRCGACGTATFPIVPVCARCGAAEMQDERTAGGVVEQATERTHRTYEAKRLLVGGWNERRRVPIAAVRTDAGPVVVALSPDAAPPGARVTLEQHSGVPVARIAGEPRH
jgi:uncharacterized OB-fold protein